MWPMTEISRRRPDDVALFTTIVVAILRVLHNVNIHKHFDIILGTNVIKPLDVVFSAVSAADIGSILIESKVTNRKT